MVPAFIKNLWSAGIVGTFLAGLFVLMPIVLTIVIFNWVIEKIATVLGPGSFLGDLLMTGGGSIIGSNHAILAYLFGILIAITLIWLLGLLVKARAKQRFNRSIDELFERIPVIRSIYKPVAQVMRLFSTEDNKELKSMTVVMCRFGGAAGADILALLTRPEVYTINGERRQLIYMPTSPLPMSGGLIFVAEANIYPVPGMAVDDLMKIYLSLGVLAPETVGRELGIGDRH